MAASCLCHSAIPRGQGNVNQDFSAVEIPSVGDLKAVVRGGRALPLLWELCLLQRQPELPDTCLGPVMSAPSRPSTCEAVHSDRETGLFERMQGRGWQQAGRYPCGITMQ